MLRYDTYCQGALAVNSGGWFDGSWYVAAGWCDLESWSLFALCNRPWSAHPRNNLHRITGPFLVLRAWYGLLPQLDALFWSPCRCDGRAFRSFLLRVALQPCKPQAWNPVRRLCPTTGSCPSSCARVDPPSCAQGIDFQKPRVRHLGCAQLPVSVSLRLHGLYNLHQSSCHSSRGGAQVFHWAGDHL